jgi:DNA-directed RNA polymerase subunit RPC12/RpoP
MCPPPPPSSAEKQLLRYECEKCGTMQHTYTRQDGIKCIVCGGSMNKVLWFNPDGTSTKPPTRSMI